MHKNTANQQAQLHNHRTVNHRGGSDSVVEHSQKQNKYLTKGAQVSDTAERESTNEIPSVSNRRNEAVGKRCQRDANGARSWNRKGRT